MMLEAIFQNYIKNIQDVLNSHKKDPQKKAMFSRDWEFIFSDLKGWIVLHCSTYENIGGYWIYPMLYPESKVKSLKEQLPEFSFWPSSVAYSHVSNGKNEHWIEPYWKEDEDFINSEIPLFFCRNYYGKPRGKENYFEFNQLITHLLDLHWSEQKDSYCLIDEYGDEIEKIKIINEEYIKLILIRRTALDKLLYLGKWVLARYFCFNRYKTNNPNFDNCTYETVEPTEYEAKFNIRICGEDYIEFRGAQIERPCTSKEILLSWNAGYNEEEKKKYAEFIVIDWKNKKTLRNYPVDPKKYANYFTQSDLPFEISPIFFKAEVLDKYKNNPDKYSLSERDISCRGGWHLETYDINEYNQVHTYAIYLSRLPYKEQLHWKQYNEEPKGGISKRAYQTDFEAKWPDELSKLEELKISLEKLGELKIGEKELVVWSPKGGSWDIASKGLYYVNSENSNEWHNFIIALNNVVNEGFQIQSLRKIASLLGREDQKVGTLGLIKHILNSSGNIEKILSIHAVLSDLQKTRSKGKAHGAWETPVGSLIQDSNKRLQDVIDAIKELTQVFESLNIPKQ